MMRPEKTCGNCGRKIARGVYCKRCLRIRMNIERETPVVIPSRDVPVEEPASEEEKAFSRPKPEPLTHNEIEVLKTRKKRDQARKSRKRRR